MNFYLRAFFHLLPNRSIHHWRRICHGSFNRGRPGRQTKMDKKEDFLDLMALAQTVPGIFAVNIAIFIGYKLKGFWGAFWMALGTILPSFLIILAIALFFRQFQHVEAVEHVFKGIRPAVVALIAAPTFKMAKSARINRYNIWIPVVSALLIWLLGFSPIYVIILSGLGGYLYGRYQKKYN